MHSIAVWLLVGIVCVVPLAGDQPEPADRSVPEELSIERERALIVSPHPDDATLGASGFIQRVIAGGGSVRVAQLTAGDGFSTGVMAMRPGVPPTPVEYRWYASVREREALGAMRRLGVGRANVRLLGFPDDGLCALTSRYRTGVAFESPYTRREAPPDAEQMVQGTMYRGDDLIRELTEIIIGFRPTIVVLPHSGDQHPDHCATHLLVHEAVENAVGVRARRPRVLHYLVHYPNWPAPGGAAALPRTGLADGWVWRSLALTDREQAAKRAAVSRFHSQALVMQTFLDSFVRSDEFFIEGEPPLPIPCWCGGENITTAARSVH
jgi:LmbE family N-acetylglucosaminyl deacetylase